MPTAPFGVPRDAAQRRRPRPVTAQLPTSPRPRSSAPLRRRLPLLVLGVICLLAGLWGGLLLLGLSLPTLRASTAADHGPLMVLGFLGTVISLERAVAVRRWWAFAAPIAAGAGGVALLAGLPATLGWSLLCLASVIFIVIYVVVLRMQPSLHLAVEAVGAVCWYVATVLWLGGATIPRLVPWLAGFLVLTIIGERLELARVALLTPASLRWFGVAAGLLVAGLVLTAMADQIADAGVRVAGAGFLAMALWGARYDVARRTIKIAGLTRFMAACLLSGYVWLFAAGAIWLAAGDLGQGIALYDAALHAVFLGYVMSMIFAHAPVILPAVLGVRLPFHPSFYIHVALLHAALLVRLVAGDAFDSRGAWQVGGIGTELAVVVFIVVSATAVLRARRS